VLGLERVGGGLRRGLGGAPEPHQEAGQLGPEPARAAGAGKRQPAGCRLIGPYTFSPSSSRLTWSTPASSRLRQCSPIQLSASPWLPKVSFGRPRDASTVPSCCSSCQLQVTAASFPCVPFLSTRPARRGRPG